MAVGDDFLKMLQGIQGYYAKDFPNDPFVNWEQITNKYELTPNEFTNTVELLPQANVIRNTDGSIRSYNVSAMIENPPSTAESINSNASTQQISSVEVPANTTVDPVSGNVKATTGAVAASGTAAAGIVKFKKYIPAALLLASTATRAGLILQPDYWDTHTTDPILSILKNVDAEKYKQITIKDDEIAQSTPDAAFFDGFFRQFIDPISGLLKGEMYVDEESLAYMAKAMSVAGAFDVNQTGAEVDVEEVIYNTKVSDYFELPLIAGKKYSSKLTPSDNLTFFVEILQSGSYLFACDNTGHAQYPERPYTILICSDQPDVLTLQTVRDDSTGHEDTQTSRWDMTDSYTYRNQTVYYRMVRNAASVTTDAPIQNTKIAFNTSTAFEVVAWNIIYSGDPIEGTGVEGLDVQQGASVLNIEPDDTISEIIQKIETQYPEMATKKITQQVVQPDGSVKTYTYVPVPAPEGNPREVEDPYAKPVTGTRTQTETEIEPETDEESEVEPITQYIVEIATSTPTKTETDTGGGNTPPIVIPTGSASALYTVYNPTNTEINNFGSWLWSANFVDQLLKMFNDPMQAIISLHKVFCSPSVSGRDSIKVGYLDSGVSANVVDAQYVTIDCGSVNLSEQYQNVFDYPPFTDVTLYLPFVGFVKLDPNDVMRATISVIYHVDVLTGACLAEVNVTRDMFGGVIYQYSGDCSVHYPLSSGSYMGIVSALLGVAGTVASGGALAPMAIGIAAGAMRGHANVERSGSLSGNAGAMGIKKPYLVIQRPQINTPAEFEKFTGKPSNSLVTIGECTGYIKCKEVHVINTPATESETQELVSLLKEGVIL